MTDIFISPSEDLYIVTDCMMTDLHYLLRASSKPLECQFIQFFTYQMLRGLKYIHSAGVIHRDLKPSNILIDDNCDLKICDFGLAREHDAQMTGYVATRYYRAPEIMLTWQNYNYAVDMWSVGCILAEMILGKALFPGRNHVHQFVLITELLGKPSEETLKFVDSLPKKESLGLTSILGDADPQAIDLVEKMLNVDPHGRITTADPIKHPYVVTYQDSDDEPVCDSQLDWSLLDSGLSADEWKSTIYFEILNYHRGACDWQNDDLPTNGDFEDLLLTKEMIGTY
ncbi:hypothetical protein PENFLA_c089G04789 [Penicillium flavigenum]|uniref:mitogen-activated protein kinase n=1 Tax=Penicillium flavigenum TaxID=254877 RepID=A0A1V6S942_9EURO|nr:hypothetical protein PENFLA_c089G04789 [Penicillium flavigenum]